MAVFPGLQLNIRDSTCVHSRKSPPAQKIPHQHTYQSTQVSTRTRNADINSVTHEPADYSNSFGSTPRQFPVLQVLTNGEYDLVTFDPRGTGKTLPFQCIESEVEAAQTLLQTPLGNASDAAVGALWAQGKIVGQKCKAQLEETGELVGTAFTARDLMKVAEVLEEDGLLRYWGLSYGTALGATAAAMFPDRIEKMILDGVQNPHEYYHALANFQEWTGSDEVFSAMFTGCKAAPENCTLAQNDNTAAELEQRTWDLLDQLKREPLVVAGTALDYNLVKGSLQNALYGIDSWPGVTTILDLIFKNETAALVEAFTTSIGSSASESSLELLRPLNALHGIQCGDRTARASTLDEFLPAVEDLYNISRIYGDATVPSMAACAQWPYSAKERYEGDFQVKTKNPVLILGNTGDAYTPLVSAYNLSSSLEGSVVLEIDGYGHASTSVPSSCSWKHISAFWQSLTLPKNGTLCPAEAQPFQNVTWADVFAAANTSSAGTSKRGVHAASKIGFLGRQA
ncbi:hypothetical protein M409DRAFT_64270 [Zasmidium cellare ATCC 36951]|uniref:Uncharacterized protein n=1 Tax=Zasmidium cellare ATCC 36951 TaxID=1080233 RepID=A0A6A6CYZ2_ZASCE|nr:uncharacterized protein M409DRAFT_64270 [Zasmidium cellare ATCC 36951]KAF2170586.1 hypothetical protein M409DRAFT_64270 [Zasmidium cellare ATCC 36951]